MKVVILSGGYDPIHIGHIRQFKEAKEIGDIVVVLLNSDRFLKAKKGYCFLPYEEREEILRSIKYIDSVVRVIDKDQSVCKTLGAVIRTYRKLSVRDLMPIDIVFAKGGDRNADNIPEKDICKLYGVEIINNVGGKKVSSSSELVKRVIKNKKGLK